MAKRVPARWRRARLASRLLGLSVLVGAGAAIGQGAGSAVPLGDGGAPLIAAVATGGVMTAAAPLGLSGADPLGQGGAQPLGTPMSPLRRGRSSGEGVRCTADGVHCIALDSYIADVCRTIEATAREAGLDAHFFARLIWRESLFDATAVSHAGAQGIAQFMPGTAKERGLADPFNPAEALRHSAMLLVDLRNQFGNLGLAAAAYNAGPGRVAKFVSGQSRLPGETRAYVAAITGHRGEDWRDAQPRPDYRLDGATPFALACRDKAQNRAIDAFRVAPAPGATKPWAAVLAAHRSRDIAQYRFERVAARLPKSLRVQEPIYVAASMPGLRGSQITAQLGADSRAEANTMCARAEGAGVACVVVKN